MSVLDIATYNLDHDDSGATNSCYREVLSLVTVSFTKLKLKYKASSAGWTTSHLGIAVLASGFNAKQTPIEVLFGGASGFSIGANAEITSDEIDLGAHGIVLQQGDSLLATNATVSGAPKNNTEFGTVEYWRGSDSTSWNQATPTGTFSTNLAYIGGIEVVTATDFTPPPAPTWCPVRGASVKMYPSDTPGQYVFEKPDGTALSVTGDATGGIQTVLDYGRNNNCAVEITGNAALPYDCRAPISIGTLQSHDIEIREFWLEPQVPINFDLLTIGGMDRSPSLRWHSGKIRMQAASGYQGACAVAFKPSGYRVLYPNGTIDGSPFYPGEVILPTVEAIILPSQSKTSQDNLVRFTMNATNGALNGWRIQFANVDGAGLVATPIRVTDASASSFAYNSIDFGRLSGFLDVGLLVGDTPSGRGQITGNDWFGYMETGASYGGPLTAGIKTSATFDSYEGVRAINCYGGGLSNGIWFTTAASNCYVGKSVNGRYRTQFYGCAANITDSSGNNDH